jgi:formylglycine-generating enzyme required for sulfatase activity
VIFILVPGGTYTVGAKPPTAEQPLGSPYIEDQLKAIVGIHPVELHPYFLSKYEMTQGQWLRITGESPSHYDPVRSRGIGSLAHPVESISWDDATRVARRVGFALPTDAQWEVAYRAGTSTRFPYGDAPSSLHGMENLRDRSWFSRVGFDGVEFEDTTDGFPGTAPVGTFPANALGFHDMGGNVAEPCADDWEDYVLPPRAGDGLIGLGTGGPTVGIRGASWADTSTRARAGRRDAITRDKRSDTVGVRVVFP